MTAWAAAVELGMSQVTMYSTSWCGFCRRLKLQMDQAGISYEEIDIERDPDAATFVEGVNGGNQTVPVIKYQDGSTATNPSLRDVQAQLAA
jgi:mycoredoxin